MEPLVILLAFLLGLMFRRIGLPPLLGYLVAGFIAFGLEIGSAESLAPIAEAGVTLLLFTIGLKLNLRQLAPRYVWGSALLHMLIVVPLTAAVIMLASTRFESLALQSSTAAWTLAFALSFSSTVFAIKMFEERGEAASFYAAIAIGILVVQDVFAVLYLVFASGYYPSPWALLLFGLFFIRKPLGRLLKLVGHGELSLLSGITIAFCAYGLFNAVQMKGDLGALIAGMLVAQAAPGKAKEIYDQLVGLKNLLLIGFFLQIGYYGLPSVEMTLVAAILAFVCCLRPIVYIGLLTAFRLRVRTAWLAGLSLFNYSEFGLIVAAAAVAAGLLSPDWLTTLALAMSMSFFLATPFNKLSHRLYGQYETQLMRAEKSERLPEERIESVADAQVAILGVGRVGRGVFDTLVEEGYRRVVGIEEKLARAQERREQGYHCIHGDATDRDFWAQSGLLRTEMVLVSLTNHLENLLVVDLAREVGFTGVLAAVARFPDDAVELEKHDCIAFNLYAGAGSGFARHTLEHLGDRSVLSRDPPDHVTHVIGHQQARPGADGDPDRPAV